MFSCNVLVWHTKLNDDAMTFLCRYFGILFGLRSFHQPSTCEREHGYNAGFWLRKFKNSNEHKRMKRAPIFHVCMLLLLCVPCIECFVRETEISAESWKREFSMNVWQRKSKRDCVEWEIWQQWNWFRMVFIVAHATFLVYRKRRFVFVCVWKSTYTKQPSQCIRIGP